MNKRWRIEPSCGRYEIWPVEDGEPFIGIVYRKEDAQLIAVAPELLRELKRLHAEIDAAVKARSIGHRVLNGPARIAANQLINKAEAQNDH